MSVDPRVGHTGQGVPYVLGPDTMIDYPAVSLELANWIGDHRGREVANVTHLADTGPTGVSVGNPGDALADLGVIPARVVPYWVECSLLIKASVANDVIFLLLYDGPPSAPANQVAYAPLYCGSTVPLLAYVRWRITPPAAGNRNYHVRWRNNGGAGTVYTIQNGLYPANYSMREVAR